MFLLLFLVQDLLWRETSLSALLSACNLIGFATVMKVMSLPCFSATHSSVGNAHTLAEDKKAP